MIIKEFKTFKEKYQKINEGGGAGKDFKFSCIEGDLELKVTKEGVEVTKNQIKGCGPLDIIGYMDGIKDLDPNKLFDFEIEYVLDLDLLKKLTFERIDYYLGDEYDVDLNKTVGEYLEEGNELTLHAEIRSTYSYMFGSGYLLSIMNKGNDIQFDMYDGSDDNSSMYLDDNDDVGLLAEEKILDVTIKLTANEAMENVYKEVFVDDLSYEQYLETVDDDEEPMGEEFFYETRFEHIKDEYGWED